jgi:hypothetical protein
MLALYPLAGGDPRPLPAPDPADELLRWVEYGRSLYVWRGLARPATIERLELETGRRATLARVSPADPAGVGALMEVAVTPDGRGYAYSYDRTLDELYLVTGLR